MSLAIILGIPGNNGICDYVKEIWEETKYYNQLEITRMFANDDSIGKVRRVKSSEMKPFQRLLHIFVMKNIFPRFGKRDTASFMDLTYMDCLLTRKKVNLPRLMIRHMGYVINVQHHELPYGELLTRIFEAFKVPLDDKEGEEPVKTDYFEEIFLGISQLKREDGVWWLRSGANRRRDNVEEDENEEEVAQEENEGEPNEKEAKIKGSGSIEEYFDAEDGRTIATEVAPAVTVETKKERAETVESSPRKAFQILICFIYKLR
ncbi:hypothetical protein Dimus_030488 [Dionaea muscipula]